MKLLMILAMMTWLFVTITLSQESICGDGICGGLESALPHSSHRCFDCGRLRGVIGLAVGQKDQLSNITISVWADPINPAIYLRNGTPLPAPNFITHSDTKGFFSINTLSFDAQGNNRTQGQSKRRFYFSLTGQHIDRSSGEVEELLPLWWNYELTNSQWLGAGTPTGTNNSPNLYFYMTPPFDTQDALLRVILSWGTQISNPASSLPDVDLIVAGPVDQNSMSTFGNGIVNFQNKDQHASYRLLPFAKLHFDTAQGYGPEVMDFIGAHPGSPSIEFSNTYSVGAPANAYEIWVDRPNSEANSDSSTTFLYDTNAFIVVYQNDGSVNGNKQVLFDQITNVPYAYGFGNGDQWNKIPSTATLWHVFDITQSSQRFVYNGFPGENTTVDSATPGSKYGYAGQFFEATKTLPCGHVVSRGANPAYCPVVLTYP